MTTATTHRDFVPGTTGWSVDDLDDPEIERLWLEGRYEIVEGVLTVIPAAYYDGGMALKRLIKIVENHTVLIGMGDGFSIEVDVVLNRRRLPRIDAVFLSPDEQRRQKAAQAARGKRKSLKYGRILVRPMLVIESLSIGYESHDRETKRAWYAEAGIPNYWLLNAQERSLECLVLDGGEYRTDQSGRADAELRPSTFPGLVIPLKALWAE
jgi:hypothetical protein